MHSLMKMKKKKKKKKKKKEQKLKHVVKSRYNLHIKLHCNHNLWNKRPLISNIDMFLFCISWNYIPLMLCALKHKILEKKNK